MGDRDLSGDVVARAVGVVGLGGIAMVHLLDLDSKWHETKYLAVAYVALIAACALASGLLLSRAYRAGWKLAVACAAGPMLAYVVSRTVGLPAASDDKGNWLEALGLASLYIEAMVLVLGAAVAGLIEPTMAGGMSGVDRRSADADARNVAAAS